MTINDYFQDRIYCINLASRPDRRAHAADQFRNQGIRVRWFDAYPEQDFVRDFPNGERSTRGNAGCTQSHRTLLDACIVGAWPRMLVFEDDVEFVLPNAQLNFLTVAPLLPEDWGMVYLGGSFANDPIRRINSRLVQIDGMMTTSSYAISGAAARKIAPHIWGSGPIDSIFQGFTRDLAGGSYVITPRMCVQYTNVSDIQGREMNNRMSMEDSGHLERLDAKTLKPLYS